MLKAPQTATNALWKERYRLGNLRQAQLARYAPAHGIVIRSIGGTGQIFAWDVVTGGTPDEIKEKYIASSPIAYAEQVTAPLLIIQGRNDMRCPPRQMERYVEKMQALGKTFEIDWYDAGHGGMPTETLIAFEERMLGFAYRILRDGSLV
jgi:pimeloyl-ACP methyl ester carboxylesterase